MRQILQQHFLKLDTGHGLYKIVIKSAVPVEFPILASRIRGEHNDRYLIIKSPHLTANILKTLDAIHLRHQMIHQDRIITICQGI